MPISPTTPAITSSTTTRNAAVKDSMPFETVNMHWLRSTLPYLMIEAEKKYRFSHLKEYSVPPMLSYRAYDLLVIWDRELTNRAAR